MLKKPDKKTNIIIWQKTARPFEANQIPWKKLSKNQTSVEVLPKW
jgi:hypothetical protein